MKIILDLTRVEANRLAKMCFHVSEEAHDIGRKAHLRPGEVCEPWHSEEWWTNLSYQINKQILMEDTDEESLPI